MSRGRSFRTVALGIAASVAVLLASCDSGPKAGDITATLTTSHTELGSVMFEVNALAPNTVEGLTAACSGCKAFLSTMSESKVRGIVTGPFSAGPLVHVSVSDRRTPEGYTIEVQQAALPNYETVSKVGIRLQFPTK